MEEAAVVVDTVTQTAPEAPMSGWVMWVYCAIIIAVFYFVMIRPNKKRMAEYKQMLDSLRVGDRVMAAGIYGKIKKINPDTMDIEIAKGVVITVNKNAVVKVD